MRLTIIEDIHHRHSAGIDHTAAKARDSCQAAEAVDSASASRSDYTAVVAAGKILEAVEVGSQASIVAVVEEWGTDSTRESVK